MGSPSGPLVLQEASTCIVIPGGGAFHAISRYECGLMRAAWGRGTGALREYGKAGSGIEGRQGGVSGTGRGS